MNCLFSILAALVVLTTIGCSDNKSSDTEDSGVPIGGIDAGGGADAGAGSDSGTGRDAGGLTCRESNGFLVWEPNQAGVDCGPGCRQLSDEMDGYLADWSASESYLVVVVEDTFRLLVVDIERDCRALVPYPTYVPNYPRFSYPSMSADEFAVDVQNMGPPVVVNSIAIFDIAEPSWRHRTTEKATADNLTFKRYVSFSGSHMAFVHTDGSMSQSYFGQVELLDVESRALAVISEPHRELADTAVEGDFVVWMDETEGQADIYAHRISTSNTSQLTAQLADQLHPRLDQGRVVWTDLREGEGYRHADIYMYDLEQEKLLQITDERWVQRRPDISGKRIVWQDSRACDMPYYEGDSTNVDIWMFDLEGQEEYQITSYEGSEKYPQIVRDLVFYSRVCPDEKYPSLFMQDLTLLDVAAQ